MNVPEWMIRIIYLTAARMDVPPLFGLTHVLLFFLCVGVPWVIAKQFASISNEAAVKQLVICGWILVLLECYKQLFLYVVVNAFHYNYWFFPFQLCSIAMYLCVLLPILKGSAKETVLTFLGSVSTPGAFLALLYPADMLRSYVSLTIHGFLWHAILMYIGYTVILHHRSTPGFRGFLKAAVLYLLLAGTAMILNVVFYPMATYGAKPNLFYLSPLVMSEQAVFHSIAMTLGIPAEHAIYIITYLLFCFAIHTAIARFQTKNITS